MVLISRFCPDRAFICESWNVKPPDSRRNTAISAWLPGSKVPSSGLRMAAAGRDVARSITFGKVHPEIEEFRQGRRQIEHRSLNRHLVNVAADDVRQDPLSEHRLRNVVVERSCAMADVQNQTSVVQILDLAPARAGLIREFDGRRR